MRFSRVQPEQGGSDRRFIRLEMSEGSSFILLIEPDTSGLTEYIAINKLLRENKVRVPSILSYILDDSIGLALLEDCGNNKLRDEVLKGDEARLKELYGKALGYLGRFLRITSPSISLPEFDMKVLSWEVEYFLENVLNRYCGISYSYAYLELRPLSEQVNKIMKRYRSFMHRDFQSDNLLVTESGEVVVIDFQSAHMGSALYDLASLLEDPYVNLSKPITEELKENFITKHLGEGAIRYYPKIAAHRLMQACGAYVNLSLGKGKLKFLRYLKTGLRRLLPLLETIDLRYIKGRLKRCLRKLIY